MRVTAKRWPFLCAALAVSDVSFAAPQTPARTGQPSNTADVALDEFTRRLQDYIAVRAQLARKLKPLAGTPNAAELAARQLALANALRAARAGAKPGDLVTAAAAERIRAAVLEDFKRRSAADERAAFSEVPNATRPAVNATYPADAALPTVPPLLLMNLPRLPDNLQYRFYGRHVVLLDGDLQIIVDYVADVLPIR